MTMLTVQRITGAACRLCLPSGEVPLPAAPAEVLVSAETWAAIVADPSLRAQFAPDDTTPAPPAEKE